MHTDHTCALLIESFILLLRFAAAERARLVLRLLLQAAHGQEAAQRQPRGHALRLALLLVPMEEGAGEQRGGHRHRAQHHKQRAEALHGQADAVHHVLVALPAALLTKTRNLVRIFVLLWF
jgi:hypothetical protein